MIFSAAKAMTATVTHLLDDRGALPHRRPRLRVHPRVRVARQGRDHDRARPLPPRGRGEPARRGARPRQPRPPRPPPAAAVRRQAAHPAREAARLPRHLGRLHPRRDHRAGDRQVDPPGDAGGDPRPARLPLGQLRRGGGRRRRGRALLPDRAAAAAAGLDAARARARPAAGRGHADLQRPALPHGRDPGRQRRHHRRRAVALLRAALARRRARRRPHPQRPRRSAVRRSSAPTASST